MIACPACNSSSAAYRNGRRRCRSCGLRFWKHEGLQREKKMCRGSIVKERPRTPKYHGAKAGKIIYPGYVYGGTRLG